MVEKKKGVIAKKVAKDKKTKPAKKEKKEEGCSGQCWCCGGHKDSDEEEE